MRASRVSPVFLLLSLVYYTISHVSASPHDPHFSFDFLYNEGVNAYQDEKWETCVSNIESALEDWHWYHTNLAQCREQCSNEIDESEYFSKNLDPEDRFYEGTVRTSLCVVKCKKKVFGSRMDRIVEDHIIDDFRMNKPYDYLQLCYFKLERYKDAADGAATVLIAQPDHEVMKNNLRHFIEKNGIEPESVINKELKEYGLDYIKGTRAYNDGNHTDTIKYMEKSLEEFYQIDKECRRLCENSIDQKMLNEFVLTVANQYAHTLRCKRRCESTHSNLLGDTVDDFYSSYFHYLQFAYYKEGDYVKACEALASALYLNPDDEVHLQNKELYLSGEGVTEDMFVPRKSVVQYKEREDFEANLMNFIESSFLFLNDDTLEDVEGDEYVMSTVTPPLSTNESSSNEDDATTQVTIETSQSGNGEL